MVPPTQTDVYVSMTMVLLGAILFAVFIGYLTSVVKCYNASKRLYVEKYSSVKHYMILENFHQSSGTVIVINMHLEGKMMSCSDFLEFLTFDRISPLDALLSFAGGWQHWSPEIPGSCYSGEILSGVRSSRESVQLMIFSFKRILITITDDKWNCRFHNLWTIRHGHFEPAQNHVSPVFQTLGLLKS